MLHISLAMVSMFFFQVENNSSLMVRFIFESSSPSSLDCAIMIDCELRYDRDRGRLLRHWSQHVRIIRSSPDREDEVS